MYTIAIISLILLTVDVISRVDNTKRLQPTTMTLRQLEELFNIIIQYIGAKHFVN